VLGIPFATFLAISLAISLASRARAGGVVYVGNAQLVITIAVEIGLALVIVPYLAKQGWRPRSIAGLPTLFDLLRGLGVCLAAYLAIYLVFGALYFVAPAVAETFRAPLITGTVSPIVLVAVVIINPAFEEFLWLGYIIPAFGARYGVAIAIAVSIALRVAAHAYQGTLALITILPMATVFTWYFIRTGRLWPVIIAHMLADSVGLLLLAPGR
jgi:membrane protease YdiL (CAAX protease family)